MSYESCVFPGIEVHEDKDAAKDFLKSKRMGYNDKLK